MPDVLLNFIAFAAYLGLAAYFRPGGPTCCKSIGPRRLLLFLPLALHLYLLNELVMPAAGLSLGFGTTISAVAALTVLFYGLAAWRYPLSGLQGFVLLFGALGVLLQGMMPEGHTIPVAGQPLFRLHMLAAFAAYGLFAVAALHAALISLAEKHLHRPVPPRMVACLPPLLTLEKLLFRMVELGFLILTLTLLSGIFFSEAIYGRAFPLTHMTIFGLASWAIYAALLVGRRVHGWRGRRAIYWSLAGFSMLVFSYVGVKFVLEVLLGRV